MGGLTGTSIVVLPVDGGCDISGGDDLAVTPPATTPAPGGGMIPYLVGYDGTPTSVTERRLVAAFIRFHPGGGIQRCHRRVCRTLGMGKHFAVAARRSTRMDRRHLLALGGAATAGALAGCLGEGGASQETPELTDEALADAGVVTVEVDDASVDDAFDRITTTIEDNEDLGLIADLDHQENAASVGMDLPPTRVVFFGNPRAGTPLMQRSRQAGLDLPQRMLIWDDDGTVKVSYNDPEHVAARHGIDGQDELLENIAGALDAIATGEM